MSNITNDIEDGEVNLVAAESSIETESVECSSEPVQELAVIDHPLVKVVLILATLNLWVGPLSSIIAVYCPLVPYQVFEVLPLGFFFVLTVLSPMVSVLCVLLGDVVRRTYSETKHTKKSLKMLVRSQRQSVCASALWLLVVISGILTFTFS